MERRYWLLTSCLLLTIFTCAQNVGINNTGATPHSSAMLDVLSSNKGILIPRLSAVQRQSIAGPATGLLTFQVDNDYGFHAFDGGQWYNVTPMVSRNRTLHNLHFIAPGHSDTAFIFGGNSINSLNGMHAFLFASTKAAFRAGRAEADDFDYDSLGSYSAAFGRGPIASGNGSFAAGLDVIARGSYSASFGLVSRATGMGSFAFGFDARADAAHALAGGYSSRARGEYSLAFGYANVTSAHGAVALGFANESWGINSFSSGAENKIYGSSGMITGFDNEVWGDHSFAAGYHNTTRSTRSAIFGNDNIAQSPNELVVGQFNDTIAGPSPSTWAFDQPLIIAGAGNNHSARSNAWVLYKNGVHYIKPLMSAPATTSNRLYSIGNNLWFNGKMLGENLFTRYNQIIHNGDWYGNTADTLFLFGSPQLNNNMTVDDNSRIVFLKPRHAFRAGSVNSDQWDYHNIGLGSAAFGVNTRAQGNYSFAAGQTARALGNYSFAHGQESIAGGSHSVALGNDIEANGEASVAMGRFSKATGLSSVAIGENALATGMSSISLNESNESVGVASMATGFLTRSVGDASFSMGSMTISKGLFSVAAGQGTTSKSFTEVVIGQYNDTLQSTGPSPTTWQTNDALFIAGNGTGPNARSNAMTVYKDGSMKVQKSIEVGTTATPLSNIQARTVTVGPCANSNGFCFFDIIFTENYAVAPSIIIVTPLTESGLTVTDTFSTTVRNITTSGFTVTIKRTDVSSSWGQQLRISYIAIQ